MLKDKHHGKIATPSSYSDLAVRRGSDCKQLHNLHILAQAVEYFVYLVSDERGGKTDGYGCHGYQQR